MRKFKDLAPYLLRMCACVALLLVVSCADDDEFAAGYLPSSQALDVQQSRFEWTNSQGDDIFSLRLYNTSRTKMSNVGRVSIGAERDTLFGDRRSGFYSQYTPLSSLDEDGFGLEVMLDSVMIYFNLYEYHGDIDDTFTYEVREVINDDFIRNSADTVFSYMTVDEMVADGILGDILFEFDYPNANHPIDYDTDSISMSVITEAGYDLLDGLMLKERASGLQIDYDIYNDNHEIFVDNFKGLSIMPKPFTTEAVPSGATYGVVLEMSGWGFYGRSKMDDDPSLIEDTVSMTYVFRDASLYEESTNEDYLDAPGGVSINYVDRDFADAAFDVACVGTDSSTSVAATLDTLFIEGMGGVVSELTIEKAFFEELELVMATRNAELDEDFDNLYINAARLQLYIPGMESYSAVADGTYDPLSVYAIYEYMPARLGLYYNFATLLDDSGSTELLAVSDYNYLYEINYSIFSEYDGALNRSRGNYEMNIQLHLQGLWGMWRDAVEAAGSAEAVDWSAITWNKLYVAPLAEDLFTVQRLILQGAPRSESSAGAPIRLLMTYTLFKS